MKENEYFNILWDHHNRQIQENRDIHKSLNLIREDIKLLCELRLKLIINNQQQREKMQIDDNSHWIIGKAYFIRTVTMHVIGKLEKITDKELVLSSASWIADSGRFHDALKTGDLCEVEPFINDIIVNRNSIIDATEWTHSINLVQK